MTDYGGVQFEEEAVATPLYKKSNSSILSVITGFLVTNGLAKDTETAQYILLGVVVVIIGIAIGIAILSNIHNSSPANLNLYIQQMNARAAAMSQPR